MQRKGHDKTLMRYAVIMIFVFILCFNAEGVVYQDKLKADHVEIINDGDYFQKVRDLITMSSVKVYVVMFSMNHYPEHPDSPSNKLIAELVEAVKRGVDVKVILNADDPVGLFKKEIRPLQHKDVVEIFENFNVPYKLDKPDVLSHAKLIIIDNTYTVVGSTNWSYSGITKNHEANVIIKSKDVNKQETEYFDSIWDSLGALPAVEEDRGKAAVEPW